MENLKTTGLHEVIVRVYPEVPSYIKGERNTEA